MFVLFIKSFNMHVLSLILTLRSSQILFLKLPLKMAEEKRETSIYPTLSTEGHIEVIEQKIYSLPGSFPTMNSLRMSLVETPFKKKSLDIQLHFVHKFYNVWKNTSFKCKGHNEKT